MIHNKFKIAFFVSFSFFSSIVLLTLSCSEEFLNIKPDKQMVVPRQLKDLRALLDNTMKMNISMPYFVEVAADDMYFNLNSYTTLTSEEAKLAYIWESSPYYNNNSSTAWNARYEQIFYCNLVLEAVEKYNPSNKIEEKERNEIKGSALFYRAWAYWQLAQLFCGPYKIDSSNTELGLPLRLTSNINEIVNRSSISDTWGQMLLDLNQSMELVPKSSEWKTRPTLPSVFSFLSRVYLAMGEYQKSSNMAEKCLELNDSLLNYANMNSSKSYPIDKFNVEVLFHSVMASTVTIRETRLNVDTILYNSYDQSDLRKICYFYHNNGIRYKGSYNGDRDFFCGLSTSETLLNLAESELRLGNISSSVQIMDKLLSNRYSTNEYKKNLTDNAEQLLQFILKERRKELVFRGIRWFDLRRLNQDPRFSKTLTRKLDMEYSLSPNSPKYVFPIPQNVIDKSGIVQN